MFSNVLFHHLGRKQIHHTENSRSALDEIKVTRRTLLLWHLLLYDIDPVDTNYRQYNIVLRWVELVIVSILFRRYLKSHRTCGTRDLQSVHLNDTPLEVKSLNIRTPHTSNILPPYIVQLHDPTDWCFHLSSP